MKPFLILLLCVAAISAAAQTVKLGQSKTAIMEAMKKEPGISFMGEKIADDGTPLIAYFDGDDVISLAYYFKNDRCFQYRVTYPIGQFTDVVATMNRLNNRLDDHTWSNSRQHYTVELKMDIKLKIFWFDYKEDRP